ncbi:MAG: hypothetical protein GX247_03220 [Mollicutes bacterium]|nr:hypothetical protein [Mollicutes bacterium]
MKNKEIKLLNLQMIGNIVFIGTLIVSLILLYNKKLSLLKAKTFLNSKEKDLIYVSNQFIVFILALIFLYINYEKYKDYNNSKEKDLESLNLIASLLIFIATIITLYTASKEVEEGDFILQTPFI